eukprot:180214-Amphidinium_carterae.1
MQDTLVQPQDCSGAAMRALREGQCKLRTPKNTPKNNKVPKNRRNEEVNKYVYLVSSLRCLSSQKTRNESQFDLPARSHSDCNLLIARSHGVARRGARMGCWEDRWPCNISAPQKAFVLNSAPESNLVKPKVPRRHSVQALLMESQSEHEAAARHDSCRGNVTPEQQHLGQAQLQVSLHWVFQAGHAYLRRAARQHVR